MAVWVFVFLDLNMGGTDTLVYRVMNTELLLLVPLATLITAGLCGGLWARYATYGATEFDIFGGVIRFLFGWFTIAIFSFFALALLRSLAWSVFY